MWLTPARSRRQKEKIRLSAVEIKELQMSAIEPAGEKSAIEPAGEKIVKNLRQAVERLHDDLARVELWAGALGCFSKPIPDYGHGQTRFDLPIEETSSSRKPDAPHRNGTAGLDSRPRHSTKNSAPKR
jgi:hypothetical protein